MRWGPWLFSAKLAWRRRVLRYVTVVTCLLMVGMSGYYWARVLPAGRKSGTVVYHYNIYFGIDDIRAWPWAFLLPAVWIALTSACLFWAFVSYHQDSQFSASLIVFSLLWSLPWMAALFYLTLLNR